MIKSWANGTEHRRVFVLEQAAEFLRSHGIGVGDAVGICTDENGEPDLTSVLLGQMLLLCAPKGSLQQFAGQAGAHEHHVLPAAPAHLPALPDRPAGELVVEANTEEVRQATVSPKYGALALAAPPPGATAAVPLAAGASGRCIRSPHCTKAAGHPGFCSGPKAAAAAAAKQSRAAAHHAHHSPRHAHHHHGAYACQPGTSDASARGAAAGSGSSGEEAATRLGTPRAAAGRQAAITSTAEFASAAAAAGAALPDSLGLPPYDIAAVPAGLRICKALTAYDLTSRRVVMPAPEVEAGVLNAGTTDLLTLAAVDEGQVRFCSRLTCCAQSKVLCPHGQSAFWAHACTASPLLGSLTLPCLPSRHRLQRWVFPTLRAWTNVAARRGYLLDGLADWLANRSACEGDCLAIFRSSDTSPPVSTRSSSRSGFRGRVDPGRQWVAALMCGRWGTAAVYAGCCWHHASSPSAPFSAGQLGC